MMAKMGQELKREKNRAKRAKIESTTNKYMINLAWGIFVIILFRFIETGYMSSDTVLIMPTLMKVVASVLAVIGVALCICGKLNIANRRETFYNYGIFAFVMMAGAFWVGFFNQIRNFFVEINPVISNIDSRWWISRGPISVIAIYLVITLIWTTIKITLIEKGKSF